MFIVRVDYKNGQHLEYMYAGQNALGSANATFELVVRAQKAALGVTTGKDGQKIFGDPSIVICEPQDDAGRNGSVLGIDVQAVHLVDVAREAAGAVLLKQFVERIARKMDPDAFRQPPNGAFAPDPRAAGEERPAIGRTPTFSS